MQSDGWLWLFIRERPWLELVAALVLVGVLVAIFRGAAAWRRARKGLTKIPMEEELEGDWRAKSAAAHTGTRL
jgi:hypothetical protein